MVTWGANTVQTFDRTAAAAVGNMPATTTPAAAAPLFSFGGGQTTQGNGGGAAAAASSSSSAPPLPSAFSSTLPLSTFGGTSASSAAGTGSSSSQPATTSSSNSLFGSTTSPAATPLFGNFFGSSQGIGSPAINAVSANGGAGSSIFSTSQPQQQPPPSSSLSSSLFGSNTSTPLQQSSFSSSSSSLFPNPTSTGATGTSSSIFGSSPTISSTLFPVGQALSPAPFAFQPQPQPLQPPPQQQPVWMVPAQAALHARLQAEAHQEESRIYQSLQRIHAAYSGTATTAAPEALLLSSASASAPFTLVHYTDASPEWRQHMWLHASIVGEAAANTAAPPAADHTMIPVILPPRPAQVSVHEWHAAIANNPDPTSLMPSVLVGAPALQSRLAYQQEKSNALHQQLSLVQGTLNMLEQCDHSTHQRLHALRHTRWQRQQRPRILALLKQVEWLRCFAQPLQPGEMRAYEQLRAAMEFLQHTLTPLLQSLQHMSIAQTTTTRDDDDDDDSRRRRRPNTHPHPHHPPVSDAYRDHSNSNSNNNHHLADTTVQQLHARLREQAQGIHKLQAALQGPVRDVALIEQRLLATTQVPSLPMSPPHVSLLRK